MIWFLKGFFWFLAGFLEFSIGLCLIWYGSPSFVKKYIKSLLKFPLNRSSDEYSLIDHQEKSRHISQKVKDKVWNRDGGKCVQCGSNEDLEFDHIIPHSKGGANTYRNIQLLCEPCNRKKSAKIG